MQHWCNFLGSSILQFKFKVDTTLVPAASSTMELDANVGVDYYAKIDWGDGTSNNIKIESDPNWIHEYGEGNGGIYDIIITGKLPEFTFDFAGNGKLKVISVSDYGLLNFYDDELFDGCINLNTFNSDNPPNSINTTSLSRFFQGAALSAINNLDKWDVSNVTNFEQMFYLNSANLDFTGTGIDQWDMSNAQNIANMFFSTGLDVDLGSAWNITSQLTNASFTFRSTPFNYDLTSWDMSNVTTIESMLRTTTNFNQNLSGWNLSSVTNATFFLAGNTAMSTANIDNLLYAMETTNQNNSYSFHLGANNYSAYTRTHTISLSGNAQIDTAQSKFHGSSLLLDGNGDYIAISDSDDWNMVSGDFTIECWTRFNSVSASQVIFAQTPDTNNRFNLFWSHSANELNFEARSGGTWELAYEVPFTPLSGTWYHIAIERSTNTWRTYIDGTAGTNNLSLGSYSNTMPNLSGDFLIGNRTLDNPYLNGWIDEFRVSKGIARYGGNFTPATSPFENDVNTNLLLHFKGSDADTLALDDDGSGEYYHDALVNHHSVTITSSGPV
jgi:hypothetical protein